MIELKDLDSLPCGNSLTLEERALLKPALENLKLRAGLLTCGVWGKMLGDTADYIIVVGTTKGNFLAGETPNKVFYYCLSNKIKLVPLSLNDGSPEVSTRTVLTGDPNTELGKLPTGSEEGEGEIPYLESDHLGYIVKQVEWHTCVIPRGAYVTDAYRNVLPSISFRGLGLEDALSLDSYLHFRQPKEPVNAYDKRGLLKAVDYLDPIPTSHPRGGWALQKDPTGSKVYLRSLLFPGYSFFHHVNQGAFGGFYVGDGVKNEDIAFMV